MIDPVFFGQQGLVISVSMLVWSFTMIGEEPALLKKQDDVGNYMQMLLFIRIIIVCVLIAVMVFLWSVGWLPGSGDVRNYIIIVFLLQAFDLRSVQCRGEYSEINVLSPTGAL
jgi:hypothetical protein